MLPSLGLLLVDFVGVEEFLRGNIPAALVVEFSIEAGEIPLVAGSAVLGDLNDERVFVAIGIDRLDVLGVASWLRLIWWLSCDC